MPGAAPNAAADATLMMPLGAWDGGFAVVAAAPRPAATAEFDRERRTDPAAGTGHHRRRATACGVPFQQLVQGAEHRRPASSASALASCNAWATNRAT